MNLDPNHAMKFSKFVLASRSSTAAHDQIQLHLSPRCGKVASVNGCVVSYGGLAENLQINNDCVLLIKSVNSGIGQNHTSCQGG